MICRIMGFDFGLQRTGVATANTLTQTATPQCTLQSQKGQSDWQNIDRLVKEWQPQQFIVGLPETKDGKPHQMAKPIQQFCQQLEARYQLPIALVNELLSSQEARQRLKRSRQQGRKKKIRREEIDALSAAIILESWLQKQTLS